MLQLSDTLINRPVVSLRIGKPVAFVVSPIINPNNLKIEGFYCQDNVSKERLVLLSQDIREQNTHGFWINDHEVLSDPDELIRLKEVIALNFVLTDKPVVTSDKKRIGKVTDYAVESESLYVQKLYVGQSLLKSFSGGQLSVDRNQIIEITNRKIVVQDPLQGVKAPAGAAAIA